MLKYFFYTFVLLIVLVVSIAGFRGQKSTKPPFEFFPDMDRQPKVKAQVPSNFYSITFFTAYFKLSPLSSSPPINMAIN
jgi:hypothetical protein